MNGDSAEDLTATSVTDDLASPEETAELRGEALVWQQMLHQASAQLADLAAYPHSRLRRRALDAAAEHARSAEKLLRALDGVLDAKQSDAGRSLSTRQLSERVERERRVLEEAN